MEKWKDMETIITWLVVLTPLKNISHWEGLSHIYIYIMENKKMFQTINQLQNVNGFIDDMI